MPRGRPKTFDPDHVLEAATAVFRRRGYAGTSVADLVAATGVHRASLYAEFGGKAGLFDAALAAYVADLAPFGALLAAEPLGRANVVRYFAALAEADFPGGCFVINTIRERDVVPPASFARVEALTAGVEAGFRANLEAARERGELGTDADVSALAMLLAAAEMGLLSYRILSDDAAGRRRVVAEVERLLA